MRPHVVHRTMLAPLVAVAIALSAAEIACADPVSNRVNYTVVPDTIAGTNWNGLGTWSVDYQRLAGGSPEVTEVINDAIEAQAHALVSATDHSATNNRQWRFHATGTLQFRPATISELFIGEYDTDPPNMPFRSVATTVFDSRTGIPITWDNLFTDKQQGLNRLSEQTKVILPTRYSPPAGGRWNYDAFAAAEKNFPAWMPTKDGVELHFADFQFGRGLPVITVPWARVADVITGEFRAVMG